MTFEKLSKNCPWLFVHSVNKSFQICKASSFVLRTPGANLQPDFRPGGKNLVCNRKNCAVWYWIKAARIGIK